MHIIYLISKSAQFTNEPEMYAKEHLGMSLQGQILSSSVFGYFKNVLLSCIMGVIVCYIHSNIAHFRWLGGSSVPNFQRKHLRVNRTQFDFNGPSGLRSDSFCESLRHTPSNGNSSHVVLPCHLKRKALSVVCFYLVLLVWLLQA